MEKSKTSKKELKGLINDTFQEAIGRLDLPAPSKKVKKLLYRNAKKLASVYSNILKREEKKNRKQQKAAEAPALKKEKKTRKAVLAAELA